VFEPDQVRGRGVWIDDGRTVWHLGDRLEVDGVQTPLADLRSRSQYGLMPALPIDPQVAPLDDDHGRHILQVLKDCGWQGLSDHLHLAGFVVLSNVGGALRKRPGLQATSPYGSGKSDTIENGILPLQGGVGRISSGSTEAGIRQLIGRDALPCTIDESEAEDGRKREAQLRLVRFSYDGNPQVKGTPSGEAMTFCLRSSLCLAGINAPIDNPADRSRMAVIGRRMMPADQWAQVQKRRAELITVDVGQRLLRRTVSNLPALLKNIATMGRVISGQMASNEGGRAGDTYGALLAGAHHLASTQELTEDEALAWLDSVGWDITHADTDDTDRKAGAEGRQCLEYLLAHELRWIDPGDRESGRPSTGSLTVRELVNIAHNSPRSIDGQEARTALGRKGIHATVDGLAVARSSSPGAVAIFSATKWMKGGHGSRLLEIEGTTRTNGTMRFPQGGSHRAVIVPWAAVGPLGEE
jgi:putative DNA primase/helicase